jgi:hypothetical protein
MEIAGKETHGVGDPGTGDHDIVVHHDMNPAIASRPKVAQGTPIGGGHSGGEITRT